MKKFSKILMSGLAALCLWACSDEANVSQPANAENDVDRKSTRLNSSHVSESRMPSSA